MEEIIVFYQLLNEILMARVAVLIFYIKWFFLEDPLRELNYLHRYQRKFYGDISWCIWFA